MFEWLSISDIDRLREHKEALKMERRAYALCDEDRRDLRDKLKAIGELLAELRL